MINQYEMNVRSKEKKLAVAEERKKIGKYFLAIWKGDDDIQVSINKTVLGCEALERGEDITGALEVEK